MIIISPAKNLDFSHNKTFEKQSSEPSFLNKTNFLAKKLKSLSASELKSIMKISDKLSTLNKERYKSFSFSNGYNYKQAVFAFNGDTYKGLNINSFSSSDIIKAQKRLRILSGLYGILKPLDIIQPYRLEMGSNISSLIGSNLYDFWSKEVTKNINDEMKKSKTKFLINLASVEYFNVININNLDFKVVNPIFLQKKDNKFVNIGIISKRSKGMLASYLLKNNYSSIEEIKSFNLDGYAYESCDENDNNIFFVR